MTSEQHPDPRKRQLPGMAGLCAVLSLWCWGEARSLESKSDAYYAQVAQIARMSEDAARVVALRDAPQLATDREKPNDELLAFIRDAMKTAGVPRERWIGNDPMPAVRVPKTPYKRLSNRLRFEHLDLRSLVTFAVTLTQTDPALHISSLRLLAPRREHAQTWNVDLTLSYLIFSPQAPQ